MTIFHALARMGVEALVIVSPKEPIISVGYFQDTKAEVDLDYIEKKKLGIMRREVGGGATYLDHNQVFYQLIWNRNNKRFPKRIEEIFELLSIPACQTYEEFGIKARFRPTNDIVTEAGKKIAGEGGGDIGDSMVFVGGILMDFDYETMTNVLKVPEEKFRDKIYKSMRENLTTMKRELGSIPPRKDIVQVLIESFERITGHLEQAELTPELLKKMAEVESYLTSEEVLFKKTPRVYEGVKIREGVEIRFGIHKAKGGLIRACEEIAEKKIETVSLSGDFNLFPKEGLERIERAIEKKDLDAEVIKKAVAETYERERIESPGVGPDDIAKVTTEAKSP